jgi:hypothetical protein
MNKLWGTNGIGEKLGIRWETEPLRRFPRKLWLLRRLIDNFAANQGVENFGFMDFGDWNLE